jgi:hypothetical protein
MNTLKDDFTVIASMGVLGVILFIILVIFAGVFIFIPVALCFLVIAIIKYKKRQPIPLPVLYDQLQPIFPTPETYQETFIQTMLETYKDKYPPLPLLETMASVARSLYDAEELAIKPILLHPEGSAEEARYRDTLIAWRRKAEDPGRTVSVFTATLLSVFGQFTKHLPAFTRTSELDTETHLFTVSTKDILDDVRHTISDVIIPFLSKVAIEISVFQELRKQLQYNQREASAGSKLIIPPYTYAGPFDPIDAYLQETPLPELFTGHIPWKLPERTRFSSHWIVAPQGTGKTTLLSSMFYEDMKKDASIIVLDAKGDLYNQVANLEALKDRYLIIDPRESGGINPLDLEDGDITHGIEMLEYVFSSLLESKITPMQTVLFRNVFRALVTTFPNPTLSTFRDLLANGPAKYQQYIDTIDDTDLKDFFTNQLRNYTSRSTEVLWRLDLLLSNHHIRKIFLVEKTTYDIAKAMDEGKIILVNNSLGLFGEQGSEFLGRFVLSRIWAAAIRRSATNKENKPCYVYCDEAHRIIARDEKVYQVIDECRSANIALILAHQRIDQIKTPGVLTALGNCAIRYANSDDEARQLAPRLRTTPEFLQSLSQGHFAAYVRDMGLPGAVTIKVTPAPFDRMPRVTHAAPIVASPTPTSEPTPVEAETSDREYF